MTDAEQCEHRFQQRWEGGGSFCGVCLLEFPPSPPEGNVTGTCTRDNGGCAIQPDGYCGLCGVTVNAPSIDPSPFTETDHAD